jgi:NTP pyrophosphatase (non-canonical NTP hydrolase)
MIRDNNGNMDEKFKEKMKLELGDVLWYIAAVGYELGMTLEDIARANVQKLLKRRSEGKLQGSGSDR